MSVSNKTTARRVAKKAAAKIPTQPAAPPAERRPRKHIRPTLLTMLREANGEPITADEFMAKLDVPKNSVQYSMGKLCETVPQIQVVQKANIWRWADKGTAKPDDYATGNFDLPTEPELPEGRPDNIVIRAYTYVGKASDGNDVIRDHEDNLYRAVPL